jgi:hypothetical protein
VVVWLCGAARCALHATWNSVFAPVASLQFFAMLRGHRCGLRPDTNANPSLFSIGSQQAPLPRQPRQARGQGKSGLKARAG